MFKIYLIIIVLLYSPNAFGGQNNEIFRRRLVSIISNDTIRNTTNSQRVLFYPEEVYLTLSPSSSRIYILYQKDEFLLPNFLPNRIYQFVNADTITDPPDHLNDFGDFADVTRLSKSEIEYYRLYPRESDKIIDEQYSVRNFWGDLLGVFCDSLDFIQFQRADLKDKNIIRISAPHQLVRLYELPEYFSVTIDTVYYQQLPWSYRKKVFWEKESGILYKTNRKDSLYFYRTIPYLDAVSLTTGDRRNSLHLYRDHKAIVSKRISEYEIIGLALIILVLLHVFFFRRVIDRVFPTFTIELDSNDTLHSLSEEYKVEVDEILKHNPKKIQGFKRSSSLKYQGLKTIKIPRKKRYISRDAKKSNDGNTHGETEGSRGSDFNQQDENGKNVPPFQATNKGAESAESTHSQNDPGNSKQVLPQMKKIEETYRIVLEIKNKMDLGAREQEKQKKQIDTLIEERKQLIGSQETLLKEKEELSQKYLSIVPLYERYNNNAYIFNKNTREFQQIQPFIDVSYSIRNTIHQYINTLRGYKHYDNAYFIIMQIIDKFMANAHHPDWTSTDWENLEKNGVVTKIELINISKKQGDEIFLNYLRYEFFKSIYAISNSGLIMIEEVKNLEFISSITNETLRAYQDEAAKCKVKILSLLEDKIGLYLANIELFRERQRYDNTFSIKSSSDNSSPYLSAIHKNLNRDQIMEIISLKVMAFRQETSSLTSKYTESKVIIHA